MLDFNTYIFTFLTFLVPLTCLPFGFFVLTKNRSGSINRIFFCLSCSIGFWGLFLFYFCYLALTKISALEAYWLNGLLHFCAIFIAAFFLHLVINMLGLEKKMKVLLWIIYLVVFVVAALSFSSFMITTSIARYGFIYWVTPGVLYPLHLSLFSVLLIYGYYLLVDGYFRANGEKKSQILLFVLGTSIGFLGGANNYMLNYGIQMPLLSTYSNLLVQAYAFLIGYAVLKYKFLEINLYIRKGLVWSVVASLILLTYFSLVRFSDILIVNGLVQPPLKIIYIIFAFIAFNLHAFLGGLVLINNPRKILNRLFFVLSLLISVWVVCCFVQITTMRQQVAMISDLILIKVAVFTPALFFHTFSEIVGVKNKKLVLSFYMASVGLFALSFFSIFSTGISYAFGARYLTNPGPLYFLLPLLIVLNSLIIFRAIIVSRKGASGYRKIQLDYLLFSGVVVIGASIFYFLLVYRIVFTPFDNMFNIVYGIVMTYAILKHRLMDSTFVIRKGLIYSLLLGLFTGCYLLMLQLFSNYLGRHLSNYSFFVSSLLIILFSLIFQPLRDKLQEIIDNIFYRGKYDYQKTIKDLSRVAASITDLNELINKVFVTIVHTITIKNISIFILDRSSGHFILRQTTDQKIKISTLSPDYDLLIAKLNEKKEALIAEENLDLSERMGELKAAIVFPMLAKNELVGFMSLGEKLSGEVYSNEDIDLLTTLSNQMGIAIENAILNEEALDSQKRLFQADKLATVGALAAGLAHEIKNPIAAIKGYSQLIGKAIDEKDYDLIKDFERVVPRQLDRINEIVEKLLYLSKPAKMKQEEVNMNSLLEDIIKLLEKQAKSNNVKLEKEFEEIPSVKADPEQLTQAFLNLILNAIQSLGDGGYVKIKTKLFKPSTIKVQIIDNGVGIAAEKLPHIFDPFFTTKEHGSGLGLAVTKKILTDHHGAIRVDSELGKGTVFTVELSSGQ